MDYIPLINREVRSLQGNLRPRPWCIDGAIARSIHQGRGLRFPCNDRTDEFNKLLLYGLFFFARFWPVLRPLDNKTRSRCGSLRRSY